MEVDASSLVEEMGCKFMCYTLFEWVVSHGGQRHGIGTDQNEDRAALDSSLSIRNSVIPALGALVRVLWPITSGLLIVGVSHNNARPSRWGVGKMNLI